MSLVFIAYIKVSRLLLHLEISFENSVDPVHTAPYGAL